MSKGREHGVGKIEVFRNTKRAHVYTEEGVMAAYFEIGSVDSFER